jgi:hypothetical protein
MGAAIGNFVKLWTIAGLAGAPGEMQKGTKGNRTGG